MDVKEGGLALARFYKLEDDTWINIDTIVTMKYLRESDETYIFSCDDPSEHFVQKGDITFQILNANNELTMHDKNVANQIFKKFMSSISSIVSKLDQMYRKG